MSNLGRQVKKILITTGIVSMILVSSLMTGCSKKDSEPAMTTQVVTETEKDLNIRLGVEIAETVAKELADEANKQAEELDKLEAEGRVIIDAASGDILDIAPKETELNNGVQDALRNEVKAGKIAKDSIPDTVRVLCDFLDEVTQNKFISELEGLVPTTKVVETKPEVKETKSNNANNKPAETKAPAKKNNNATQPTQAPAPQPTQAAPQPTQPAPDPRASEEIDTSGWDLGDGTKVEVMKPGTAEQQGLTPEQYEAMDNIQWN